jgi:polysaccharide deacetylase 2 family uncharacterized protein YibQ
LLTVTHENNSDTQPSFGWGDWECLFLMFAKLKMPSMPSSPALNSARDKGRALSEKWLSSLKKPFVAPALAFGVFVTVLVVFLNLVSDPDAATPSVRIKLAKEDIAAPVQTAQSNAIDNQGFTMDATGIFPDTPAASFDVNQPSGEAVITMPGQDGAALKTKPNYQSSPLIKAPVASLVQPSKQGPLPIISPAGMAPANAYARPFTPNGRPLVALIIGGLGLNEQTTRDAIDSLPPEVTLSFVPYANNLQIWIDLARAKGHEVMIEVPMQPTNYPSNDPGPQTLMANSKAEDLQAHIEWALSRATGYFGVINYQGGAFFKDMNGVTLFTGALKSRGIAFIDDGQAMGIKGAWSRATVDRIVDSQINAAAITAQFTSLEASARSHGQAIGNGFAYPVTLAVAQKWAAGIEGRGFQLAPASALVH